MIFLIINITASQRAKLQEGGGKGGAGGGGVTGRKPWGERDVCSVYGVMVTEGPLFKSRKKLGRRKKKKRHVKQTIS